MGKLLFWSDGACMEGMLIDDVVICYRSNVGQAEDPKTAKYVRKFNKPAGYGLSYIYVGVPSKVVDNITAFLSGVYSIDVEPSDVGLSSSGYTWFNSTIDSDTFRVYLSNGESYTV